MQLRMCHLHDIIHWVAKRSHRRCIISIITGELRGSHAAFSISGWAGSIEGSFVYHVPLRWAGSLLAKYVKLILLPLQLFFYVAHSVCLLHYFNFLPVLPPSMASIGIFLPNVRKPKVPWFGAFRASCSSLVFLVPKGECELVILSIGNELPISNSLYCISNVFDGYGSFFMSYIIYALPF